MKITRIMLGQRQNVPARGDTGSDFRLYLFRSPVSVGTGSDERTFRSSAAIIYSSGVKRYFRPADSSPLRYDCVTFRMNHTDRQYIASIDLPVDQPVELTDSFIISSVLKNMQIRASHPGEMRDDFMELSMRMIFICLAEEGKVSEPVREIPRYEQLKLLRETVYDDPLRSWSVEEICGDMRISSTYFHRIYRQAFGVTLRQDVIESRLLKAAELLETTDLPISAIAEQCGYDSDAYFMRQFRLHRGCTPTEYRRREKP